jgi:hypothetical protein
MTRFNSHSRPAIGGRRAMLLASTLALVLMFVLASSADAGTYVIDNCPSAPSPSGDPGSWTVFGAPQNTKGSCTEGPGGFIGPLGGSMSPGNTDGVQIGVPAGSGITIREAKIWWYVPHQTSGADTFALAAVNTGAVLESGTPLNHVGTPDDFVLPSDTTELTLADYCSNDDAGNGCIFGAGENPDLELLGSQLTLSDNNLPSGTVTGGALAGTGPLSGTQSLDYDAQDSDTGVRFVQLRVDGQQVAQNDYIAKCSYTTFMACPSSESDTIAWNTATVADGQHNLEVIVENAAQNTSIIHDATITTQNAPTNTSSLGALPGPGASSSGAGAVAGYTASAGAANGSGASETAQLGLGTRSRFSCSYTHRAFRLIGRLLGAEGHPISGAVLDVMQQALGTTAAKVITHATTRTDGTFAVNIPAGPSRTIKVTYRAFSGDASYSAQANITELVSAGVQLRVTPRNTGSEGMILLTGRVDGPVPRQGVIVDLLVHYRGRWEPFRTPRTDAAGRFDVAYQFQGALGRFPFRAEVPSSQAGFPFTGGHSQVVDVATS